MTHLTDEQRAPMERAISLINSAISELRMANLHNEFELADSLRSVNVDLTDALQEMDSSCKELESTRTAVERLLYVINIAGINNLANGVELGQMSWLMKAKDAMGFAEESLLNKREGITMPTPSVYYRLSAEHESLKRKSLELVEAVTAFCHAWDTSRYDPTADYEAMKQLARDFYDDDSITFYPAPTP